MGWFLPSHMDQGAIFGLLGAWHMFSTLCSYVKSPKEFRSRTWFPVTLGGVPWKQVRYLELWVLLFIVIVFIFKQLSHATADIAAGVIQFEHLQRFQHVTFALFFLAYVTMGLVTENFPKKFPLPRGALNCTFALGFLMELMVFHFGHHPGDNLESFVHLMMQIILLCLVLLMFLEVLWPGSILIAVARCTMLIFKGTWFFQIGLLINFPYHTPLGCSILPGEEYPTCPTRESAMRAKSLQVLIFNWQFFSIVVCTCVSYAILLQLYSSQPRGHVPLNKPVPLSILTPRTTTLPKSVSPSVYFAVPEDEDVEHDSGSASDGCEDDDAQIDTPMDSESALHQASLSRRMSRNTRTQNKV
jgi:hypothetical protein